MPQRRRVFEVPDAEELLHGVAVVVASDGPASHPRRGSHDARGYGQRPARPRRLAVPTAGLAAAGAAAAGDLRLRLRITAASPRVVGEVARPKAITAGRQQQPLINHCGTLLPSWAPPALHSPPDGTEPQLCTDVYDERCRMRYSAHQHLPDGSIQMLCPQCAGRVKTNARTRNPRRRRAGGSAGGSPCRQQPGFWLRWALVAWVAGFVLWSTVTGEADVFEMVTMMVFGWLVAPKPPAPPEPPGGPVVPSARTISRLWLWATMFTAAAVPLALFLGGRVAGPLVFWCVALAALWMIWRAARASRRRRQAPWIP